MWNLLQSIIRPASQPPALEQELQEGADRFRRLLSDGTMVAAGQRLARLKTPGGLPDSAEQLLSDAAAWIGQQFQERYRGSWSDDPVLGLVLQEIGEVSGLRLVPLAVVEKQVELGAAFNLEAFFLSTAKRIEAEQRMAPGSALARRIFA